MVTTVAQIVRQGMRMAGVLGGDDEPLPSEENNAIRDLQSILESLPNTWIEVETDEDYTADQNERIRVTTQDAVTITVPSAVPGSHYSLGCCGTAIVLCEGNPDKAPKDGARVAICDVYSDSQGIYFYRADIAQWTGLLGLTRDSESPLSGDMDRYLAAMLALQINPNVNPVTAQTANEGRLRMWNRYTLRQAQTVEYF